MTGVTTGQGGLHGVEHFAMHLPALIEAETGMSLVVVIILTIIAGLGLALLFDSTQGRGRRYRRGYRVGYSEELGKRRARMRIKQEENGEKKTGWRERK